jgi:hypothetical protein
MRAYLISQMASWGALYALLFYRQFEGVNTKAQVAIAWLCAIQFGAALILLGDF